MIFIFDLDGTICFNGKNIEKELIEYIQLLQKENEVIFASARPIRDMLPLVSKSFPNTDLIGGNGSITLSNGEINVIKRINKEVYQVIKDIIEEYELDFIIDGSFNYASKDSSKDKIFEQLDPQKLAKKIPVKDISNPIKTILVNIQKNDYKNISSILNKYSNCLSINYHEEAQNIDITASGINKYTTLKKLIEKQKYIAYGNDINDHELLKNAQTSYYVVKETFNDRTEFDSILYGNNDVIESIKSYI